MPNVNKVEMICKGLECCKEPYVKNCNDPCPYLNTLECREKLCSDALSVIRELKAEVEQLKYEKEKAVRDIGLYIADAEEDARTPSRIGKGYYVGEKHGLQIAKEIVGGIRNHG